MASSTGNAVQSDAESYQQYLYRLQHPSTMTGSINLGERKPVTEESRPSAEMIRLSQNFGIIRARDLHREVYGSANESKPSPSTSSTPSKKSISGPTGPAGARDLHREVYGSANDSKPSSSTSSTLADPSRRSCLTRSLVAGTDCSGMEVLVMALQNVQLVFKHVFSCDNDK